MPGYIRPAEFDTYVVGQTAHHSKTITEADIALFAAVTGDTNPIHFDEDFASRTMFKGRIAHGITTAGLISTVLGTKLPGPGGIYMSQSLKFLAPVRIGNTVVATVEVLEVIPEKRRLVLKTTCHVGNTLVLDGEAKMFIPTFEEALAAE